MPRILIVESNTPDLVAAGRVAAQPFAATLPHLADDISLQTVSPYAASFDAAVLKDVDAVVFTGSGVDWCVDDERAQPLADAMRATFDAGLPVWGSCNGMQLAAVVLGGGSGASPNGREDGVAQQIELTGLGRSHPMLAGRCDGYGVLCIHRDEVTALPDGAELLASNAHSPVQAFAYFKDGVDFWGTQYHPEYAPIHVAGGLQWMPEAAEMVADLNAAEHNAAAAARLGTSVQELSLPIRSIELRNWLGHIANP
ncbi:MAG: type 1 glutamine amidotransferase [Paracoccaceae bacterium]